MILPDIKRNSYPNSIRRYLKGLETGGGHPPGACFNPWEVKTKEENTLLLAQRATWSKVVAEKANLQEGIQEVGAARSPTVASKNKIQRNN